MVQGGAQDDFQGGQVVLVQQGVAAKVAELAQVLAKFVFGVGGQLPGFREFRFRVGFCLLYTSDAADEL